MHPALVTSRIATDSSKDYLYGRAGPWPQPSPDHPLGESAAVLHLPDDEQEDWNEHIGARYIWTLATYWPKALAYALGNPGVVEVSEDEFNEYLTNTVFSRFLNDKLDPPDQATFASIMASQPAGTQFFKVDFTAMEYVTPYEGMYCSPTLTLIAQVPGEKKKAIAIKIGSVMVTPADTNAWRLSKLFVFQGAVHHLIISIHPVLHFPMDAINAVTKTSLPTYHVLFKLLVPHFRFSLVLDNTVLRNYFSILNNFKWLLYGCFTGPTEGLRDLIVAGYAGIKDNTSYPKYTFQNQRPKINSDYGTFLQKYYDCVHAFVKDVIALMPADQMEHVVRWAGYCHQNVPGFPDETEIQAPGKLVETVATIIWDVSVAHATDHYSYSQIVLNKVPTRLRLPPPATTNIPSFDPKTLSSLGDIFKYRMAQKLFFAPSNVTLLQDTRYDFGDPNLDALNNRFLQDLRVVDANMPAAMKYIPLEMIARGIQY